MKSVVLSCLLLCAAGSALAVKSSQWLSMKDILFDKKVPPSPLATNLAARIAACSVMPKP